MTFGNPKKWDPKTVKIEINTNKIEKLNFYTKKNKIKYKTSIRLLRLMVAIKNFEISLSAVPFVHFSRFPRRPSAFFQCPKFV